MSPTTAMELILLLLESSVPMEPHNVERLESYDSSSPTGECEICQVGGAEACAEKIGNRELGSRRDYSNKAPPRGWRQISTAVLARWWSTVPTPERGRGAIAYLPQNPFSHTLSSRWFPPPRHMPQVLRAT